MPSESQRVEAQHPLYHRLLYVSVYTYLPIILLCLAKPLYWVWQSRHYECLALLFLGLVAADFISGLAHWFFDNYGSPQTPVFGQTIELFRVHHDLPEDICLSNLVETIGHVCIWSGPLVLLHLPLLLWLDWPVWGVAWLLLFASANLFLALTNLFHKWAHQANNTAWVSWLQEHRVILNAEHHQVHHTPPYATYYCITTGWCNPLLQRLGFFPKLEALLAWVGIKKAALEVSGPQPEVVS